MRFLPYISGSGSVCASSYIATITTTALGLAIFQAVWNVSFPPATSNTVSAPLPSVSSLIRPSISSLPGTSVISARPFSFARFSLYSSVSIAMIFAGVYSRAHSIVHSPVGPAPITAAVSAGLISPILAAQYPVESISPLKSACSSVTLSGMTVRPLSANGIRAYSACPPSMRHPRAHPPCSSVQLFTKPLLQKKHSPQNVSTFIATRSPGFTFFTALPVLTTLPTNSCPSIVPGTALGTAPCLICMSLEQIVVRVTCTIASLSSSISGMGRSVRIICPFPSYTTAFIYIPHSLIESYLQNRDPSIAAIIISSLYIQGIHFSPGNLLFTRIRSTMDSILNHFGRTIS